MLHCMRWLVVTPVGDCLVADNDELVMKWIVSGWGDSPLMLHTYDCTGGMYSRSALQYIYTYNKQQ